MQPGHLFDPFDRQNRKFLSHFLRHVLQVFSLAFGRMMRLMPARCAASTFSLIPPTGTNPVRLISPVMAVSLRTGFAGHRREASAVAMVIPAEGPSLGMAPTERGCTPLRFEARDVQPHTSACDQR